MIVNIVDLNYLDLFSIKYIIIKHQVSLTNDLYSNEFKFFSG